VGGTALMRFSDRHLRRAGTAVANTGDLPGGPGITNSRVEVRRTARDFASGGPDFSALPLARMLQRYAAGRERSDEYLERGTRRHGISGVAKHFVRVMRDASRTPSVAER
jgi:hypothetical protein